MAASCEGPIPWPIRRGRYGPRIRVHRSSTRSARMVLVLPCASVTTTSSAPPSYAPATAAFASAVISSQPRSYPRPPARISSGSVRPETPSMSTETKTLIRTTSSRYGPNDGTARKDGRSVPAEAAVTPPVTGTVAAGSGAGDQAAQGLRRAGVRLRLGEEFAGEGLDPHVQAHPVTCQHPAAH